MTKMRCKETTVDSFCGNFLYEQVVPRNHFLVKLKEVIDWQRFTKKLLKYYKGKGEVGQAPYNPTIILKMLLVSFLFSISGRQTEEVVSENLPVKFFVGLGVDEKAPDHSTVTLFKNRLIENCGVKAYEELFNEIIIVAQVQGIKFSKLQVVDSVHTIANVNLIKGDRRKQEGKPPKDADACWGAKGNNLVVGKGGKKHRETEYFYGYEDQVSFNAESELVTSIIPGKAKDYDGHKLKKLVEKDLKKGIELEIVAGDKSYDDGENHYYLEQKGINSAIRLNNYRTERKDENKDGWIKLKQSQEYQKGLKERYKIERKFGEAKKWHGFARCRYIGFVRHAIQSYLTFMVINLKRLVKLLTDVSFRGEVRTYALTS